MSLLALLACLPLYTFYMSCLRSTIWATRIFGAVGLTFTGVISANIIYGFLIVIGIIKMNSDTRRTIRTGQMLSEVGVRLLFLTGIFHFIN